MTDSYCHLGEEGSTNNSFLTSDWHSDELYFKQCLGRLGRLTSLHPSLGEGMPISLLIVNCQYIE
jgi:hypothetical protein